MRKEYLAACLSQQNVTAFLGCVQPWEETHSLTFEMVMSRRQLKLFPMRSTHPADGRIHVSCISKDLGFSFTLSGLFCSYMALRYLVHQCHIWSKQLHTSMMSAFCLVLIPTWLINGPAVISRDHVASLSRWSSLASAWSCQNIYRNVICKAELRKLNQWNLCVEFSFFTKVSVGQWPPSLEFINVDPRDASMHSYLAAYGQGRCLCAIRKIKYWSEML